MAPSRALEIIILLCAANIVLTELGNNSTVSDNDNELKHLENRSSITNTALKKIENITVKEVEVVKELKHKTRRRNTDGEKKKKKHTEARSTSSSSGEKPNKGDSSSQSKDSLGVTDSSSSESTAEVKNINKRAKGWRRWHRQCTPCPEMKNKWRDPSIQWICGAYQRARRSFKSLCMMHMRNCQDGTMFVKIHDNKCQNDTKSNEKPWGKHFFYDYTVHLSGDSSKTSDSESDEESDSSSN